MPNIDFTTFDTATKFILLEELWSELSKDANSNGFTPKWHLEVLSQREERVKSNKSEFSTLSDAKKRLYKLVD